jgi:hypothetical protein
MCRQDTRACELGVSGGLVTTDTLPVHASQCRRQLDLFGGPDAPVPHGQSESLVEHAVDRYFCAHLYGLLLPGERESFLTEAHRVASEVVILDAGRPRGVNAEEWQERTLPGGDSYRVFRRHFDAYALAAEVGGVVLFAGQFYVLVSIAAIS